MKLTYALVVIISLMCTFLQVKQSSAADAATDETSTAPPMSKTTPSQTPSTSTSETTTAAGDTTTPESTATTTTTTVGTTQEPILDTVTKDVSAKCKNQVKFCYGPTSKIAKNFSPKNKEEACHTIRGKAESKTCLTKEQNSNVCTAKEFEEMETAACFCPKIGASLMLVLAMVMVSKLFGVNN